MTDPTQSGGHAHDRTPRLSLGEPTVCPFPNELLTSRFGFGGMPISVEESDRCVRARRQVLTRKLAELTVVCAPAPVHLPAGVPAAYTVRARCHTELMLNGHRIHIEATAQELGGPGGTNSEVRMYVDGLLEGRSILLAEARRHGQHLSREGYNRAGRRHDRHADTMDGVRRADRHTVAVRR